MPREKKKVYTVLSKNHLSSQKTQSTEQMGMEVPWVDDEDKSSTQCRGFNWEQGHSLLAIILLAIHI